MKDSLSVEALAMLAFGIAILYGNLARYVYIAIKKK
ncbi:hypothetical protein CLIT_10c01190 [Peptoclostridium litorale DSM 5388]|uniref:Uncharacterized protein n=1 Tax=Peptoclostridium litorale DSM 5388 TaxID=1121324 RepID=A0A069RMG8_PEPLI|nr:hypothetical protein CLIT_23c02370 [Peptoclostridium litorale DSM 5388]KDR95392.1 hypothetical protein CLIT_10c01190 [Peptoclostridium litorale DSM 5388]